MLKRLLLISVVCLCLAALPLMTGAQEAPAAEEAVAEAPAGGVNFATTAMLFIGIGAIVAVGGVMIMRENAKDGHEID